jgi:gliding motility-associated-like protein
MNKVFVLSLLLLPLSVFSNTFIVTSNADAGAGTLREAINLAKANGTTFYDTIAFNIVDQSPAGRTISLASTLPALSSKLVIDGSAQPGSKFGMSDAKIRLTCPDNINFTFITFSNCANVHIYGLHISGKQNPSNLYSYYTVTGIDFKNSDSVYLGKAGKGNYLNGLRYGFFSASDSSNYLRVQANVLGLNDFGEVDQLDKSKYNACSMSFENVRNILIGGPAVSDRNWITGDQAFIITSTRQYNNGYVQMENNFIHINYSGTSSVDIGGIYSCEIRAGNVPFQVDFDISIKNNVLTHIDFFELSKPFVVQANRFGVQANADVKLINLLPYSGQLSAAFCEGGLVGGENDVDKNIFAYASGGVSVLSSFKVHIKKNSFYCHGQAISNLYYAYLPTYPVAPPVPFIYVNSVANNTYAGKATPNAKIEVFASDDECRGCEGKKYLDKIFSDNAGNWSYTLSSTSSLVFTATNKDSGTSEFSHAEVDERNIKVKPSTCGKSIGAITGLKILSGTKIKWLNAAGAVVSTDTSAYNLAPGYYRYVLSIGDNACNFGSSFEVKDYNPIQNVTPNILPASCGKNNGYLYANYFISNDSTGYAWFNNAGDTISKRENVTNVAPGRYWFKSWLTNDTSCNKLFGPFDVINNSGSSLNLNNVNITDASCSKNNGSIKNIVVENSTGAQFFRWEDSTGAIVGNTINADNLKAGKYRLKFKDQAGCDTVLTTWFVVKNQGLILIDTSALSIKSSGCNKNDGAISGIKVTGATSFQWINSSTATVIGTNNSIDKVPPGNYQLILNNTLGCETKSRVFTVLGASFASISVIAFTATDASCNNNNGSITGLQFSSNSSSYQFNWVDSVKATPFNTLDISNLAPSTYILYAKDSNNCESKILSKKIVQRGKPVIDASVVIVNDDVCNQKIGGIKGIVVGGGAGAPYQWEWYSSANTRISTSSQIAGLPSDSYYAIVKDASQCPDTSSVFAVTNKNEVLIAPLADDQLILRGTSANLIVKNLQPYKYLLYDTMPSSLPYSVNTSGVFTSPLVFYDKAFYVQATKGTCLSSIVPVMVKVFDNARITAPNAFSPNGDGINDVWKMNTQGVQVLKSFSIYNRWGQAVYTTNHIPIIWDGTSNGKKALVGTYYYLIEGKDIFGKSIHGNGSILLVR